MNAVRAKRRPPRRPKLELLGTHETAERLGISKQSLWLRRRDPSWHFPAAIAELKSGPVWTREQIDAWAREWGELDARQRTRRDRGF